MWAGPMGEVHAGPSLARRRMRATVARGNHCQIDPVSDLYDAYSPASAHTGPTVPGSTRQDPVSFCPRRRQHHIGKLDR